MSAADTPGSDEPATDEVGATPLGRGRTAVVVVSVFVAGLCSIVYELLIGTTSAYFLGDSIKQFSMTIGLFMAAMGIGSFLSKGTGDRVMASFVWVEIALGLLGGVAVPALYLAYAYTDLYTPVMVGFIVAIGALTGLEIPLLVRVMRAHYTLKVNLANVLSLDYAGALAATLLFPFVLLPMLGTFRSGLVVGLLNLVVATLVVFAFGERFERRGKRFAVGAAVVAAVFSATTLGFAGQILKPWHDAVYEDRAVLVRNSPYQKIVITRGKHDVRLFLNGNLQFSSIDEARYHEALVHPAMAAAPVHANVLVLGGGDGMVVRELLKWPGVERVTLVDLDPAITDLARTHPLLTALNEGALEDPRVTIHNTDAFRFVDETEALYDVIVADLPDPNNASLSRLYSREFYRMVRKRLARSGVLVTQATSPYFARDAFWCIEASVAEAGLATHPYHAYVPSFGDWGFVLAAREPLQTTALEVPVATRWLTSAALPGLFVFEKDTARPAGPAISTLDRPEVLSAYLAGWKRWN